MNFNENQINLTLNSKNERYSPISTNPFGTLEVSKVKNELLKKINKCKENEKKIISLFGIKFSKEQKNQEIKDKRVSKGIDKSFSSSSVLSNLNELLKFQKKRTSVPFLNHMNIQPDILSNIQRKLKKFKTNLTLNTNNISNIKFDIINKRQNSSKNINKNLNKIKNSPFITELKEISPVNSFSDIGKNNKNNNNSKFFVTESLNDEQNIKQFNHKKLIKFNNQFSFNKFAPINIKTDSPLILNKLVKNPLSNKSLKNLKPLSILKFPLFHKKQLISFHSTNDLSSKHIKINSLNDNKNKGDSFSSVNIKNSSDEIQSIIDDKKQKKIKNKKRNYQKENLIFSLMIKNKILNLENEMNNNSKEKEKSNDEYNSYIKYMIKKYKYIYHMINTYSTYQFLKSDYDIKKDKIPKFIYSINEDNQNPKRIKIMQSARNKLHKNKHLIRYLIEDTNYINRRMNKNIDKFCEKMKYLK